MSTAEAMKLINECPKHAYVLHRMPQGQIMEPIYKCIHCPDTKYEDANVLANLADRRCSIRRKDDPGFLSKAPDWTPVTEREPEEGGEYLVTVEDQVNLNGTSVRFMWYYTAFGWEINPEVGKVLAWRDKPEPWNNRAYVEIFLPATGNDGS